MNGKNKEQKKKIAKQDPDQDMFLISQAQIESIEQAKLPLSDHANPVPDAESKEKNERLSYSASLQTIKAPVERPSTLELKPQTVKIGGLKRDRRALGY